MARHGIVTPEAGQAGADLGAGAWARAASVAADLGLLCGSVPHNPAESKHDFSTMKRRLLINQPVDAGDAGHILLAAHALGEEPVPDLPGEHGRVLLLVLADGVHHRRCGHLGLAASDYTSLVVTSLVISAESVSFYLINILKRKFSVLSSCCWNLEQILDLYIFFK